MTEVLTNTGKRVLWRWDHFTPAEFACRGTGELIVDEDFMDKLEVFRSDCGFPFVVSSGYRSPDHNARVSSTGRTGPHTTGAAVDLLTSGRHALHILSFATRYGFTGIGAKQHGPWGDRFVHLDTLSEVEGRPRPHLWTYP